MRVGDRRYAPVLRNFDDPIREPEATLPESVVEAPQSSKAPPLTGSQVPPPIGRPSSPQLTVEERIREVDRRMKIGEEKLGPRSVFFYFTNLYQVVNGEKWPGNISKGTMIATKFQSRHPSDHLDLIRHFFLVHRGRVDGDVVGPEVLSEGWDWLHTRWRGQLKDSVEMIHSLESTGGVQSSAEFLSRFNT